MSSIISTRGLEFNSMIKYPDIDIAAEETVFISGPSGCGKSTLLKLFNNTYTPSAGRILFKGTDINEYNAVGLRKKILLAGQNPYLFKGSIRDNFREFYECINTAAPPNIDEYLKMCCVEFSSDELCDSMSGGERQRVFLSIALSMRPSVFMLDEPTSALDAALSGQVIGNIISHCRREQITLIIVSHDGRLKEQYADRVIDLAGCKL